MEVFINGMRWTVVPTSKRRLLEREDGTVALGVTDRNLMCIFLWSGLRGDMLRMVVIHELCHAYLFSYGYKIPPDYEEMVCRFLHSHAAGIMDETDRLCRGIGRNVTEL